MPLYTAYCGRCDKEKDFSTPVADRDEAMLDMQCCGVHMKRKMNAPNAIKCLDFANINEGSGSRPTGEYSLGPGFRRQVSTKRDIIKLHDDYNRHYAGERHATPNFSSDII